ncbi:MAG TPA: hypothetical protein VFP77_10985 [Gemmatimonadaceae bacterium]|nr:hypothetical protein [Gemmatimonadaceae bacterium]
MTRHALIAIAVMTVAGCGREAGSDDVEAANRVGAVSVFAPDGTPRIFVADQDSSGTRLCFDAPDVGFPAGTPVTVVHSEFPQYAVTGKLGKRAKAPCFPPPRSSPDSMQYAVDAPGDTLGWHGVPIVILGKLPSARMRGDTVTLEIESRKEPWRFRTCASTEGIHATAWSGAPLSSPRRWHQYYYLGYDVEPDCTPADYEPDTTTATSN